MKAALTSVFAAFLLQAAAAYAQPTGTVEGAVGNAITGEPLLNAVVTLRAVPAGAASDTYVTKTGAGGRFAFAGVLPGDYRATPSRAGFESRRPTAAANGADLSQFTISSGQKVTGVVLHLTPLCVLTGRVLDDDGEPLSRASVEAMQYAYVSGKKQLQSRGRASTDDRGVYRIFNISAGTYYLRASHDQAPGVSGLFFVGDNRPAGPSMGFTPTYYPKARDVTQAAHVDLTAGAELRGLDIQLLQVALYAIRGKVAGLEPSAQQPNFSISAQARDGQQRPVGRGQRVNGNNFEIAGLEPGSYAVSASFADRVKPNDRFFAREFVDVAGRDVEGVVLLLSAGRDISGTVKLAGPGDVSMQNARIILQSDDFPPGGPPSAVLKPDGTFVMHNVFPDKYRVVLTIPRAYLKAVFMGDREIPDRKIDAAIATNITVMLSTDFGELEGTLTTENGEPCAGVMVTLISDRSQLDSGPQVSTIAANAKCAFDFRNVVPGEYKAYAWQNTEFGAPLDPEFRKPFEARGVALKIEPNGHASAQLNVIDPSRKPK